MSKHVTYVRLLSSIFLLPGPMLAQAPDQSNSDPIVVAADANSISKTLVIQAQRPVTRADITVGQIQNTEQPNLQIIPSIDVEESTRSGTNWLTRIKLTGLIPFGKSTVPIFFQNKKIDTLQIVKNGLTLENLPTTLFERHPLLLVLNNPSGFKYNSVRARLRFRNHDVCSYSVETFVDNKADVQAKPTTNCDQAHEWTEFEIPQYTGVSLRANSIHEWFIPEGSELSRVERVKGTLTLRFFSNPVNGQAQPVNEQNLPLEIEFRPGTLTYSRGYFLVGFWLLIGAIVSILLRVAIPNYRLFRSLREQLIEIRKLTRGISEEVDSMLRVQLRVERLSLDTLRKSVWVISPGFTGVAQRVDAGIETLRRRIGYVRRLDSAVNRKRLLIADELASPSIIIAVDRRLNAASAELASDQFREEDWVFIQRSLEAADKSLSDPTQDEKSAFETLLSQRWKRISEHFGYTPNSGWTRIPPALSGMQICFPEQTALPSNNDTDGTQWVGEIGAVRADLQIYALELIREFEFLAPTQITDHWVQARDRLIPWLATPALENLDAARSLLRELAEGVGPEDIIMALQNGEAQIELDPQSVGSGEKVHMAVRFRRPVLNSAAARQQILCEWRIKASDGARQSGTPEVEPTQTKSNPADLSRASEEPSREALYYREKGWEIYHYFEDFKKQCPLDVLFYFDGKPIMKSTGSTELVYSYVIELQSENAARRKAIKADSLRRLGFESLELLAALLVPLCALALKTANTETSAYWWQLIGLGFGSDTIRNVLSSPADTKSTK